MKKYQLGDVVNVREWDDMKKEYGRHSDQRSALNVPGVFMPEMKDACGKSARITGVFSNRVEVRNHRYKIALGLSGDTIPYMFSAEMFKETAMNTYLSDIAKSLYPASKDIIEIPE